MQTNAAALNSQVNSKKRNSSSLTDQLRAPVFLLF